MPAIIVVMGVSGCGKSTVTDALARSLGLPSLDADALHPPESVAKMSRGEPLTDADRAPWLLRVRDAAAEEYTRAGGVVVACSALRKTYRDVLRSAPHAAPYFVFIDGPRALLFTRMSARSGHFMKAKMLDSQLATLEDPRGEPGVVVVRLADSVEAQVRAAIDGLVALGMGAAVRAAKDGGPDVAAAVHAAQAATSRAASRAASRAPAPVSPPAESLAVNPLVLALTVTVLAVALGGLGFMRRLWRP